MGIVYRRACRILTVQVSHCMSDTGSTKRLQLQILKWAICHALNAEQPLSKQCSAHANEILAIVVPLPGFLDPQVRRRILFSRSQTERRPECYVTSSAGFTLRTQIYGAYAVHFAPLGHVFSATNADLRRRDRSGAECKHSYNTPSFTRGCWIVIV